jgi:ubiquinone/menaquinone biosynthesis C-methylase UbiE
MQPDEKDQPLMDQYRCPTGLQGRTVAESMNLHHSNLTDWGLKKIEIKPTFRILDVGCGGGETIKKLAKYAFEGKVFGIDYSKDMVAYSQELNSCLIAQKKVSIAECSIIKTNFPKHFFDLVTAIETYYFWPNLSDAFREIKRILKPNGNLFLINEMIKDGIYEIKNAKLIKKTHVHLVSLPKIQQLLESDGFTNVKIFRKTKSPWNAILAQKPLLPKNRL